MGDVELGRFFKKSGTNDQSGTNLEGSAKESNWLKLMDVKGDLKKKVGQGDFFEK